LGTETQNLPAFVVMYDTLGRGIPKGHAQNWGAGFLPSIYQGTTLKPQGAPLDDLLETNLLRYEDKLSSDSKEDTQFPLTDPRQGDLYLDTSIPYLTAQPQA